jgi:hypothetical protein
MVSVGLIEAITIEDSKDEMTVQIYTINLGVVNCYLLQAEKRILLDAGIPGQKKLLLRSWVK